MSGPPVWLWWAVVVSLAVAVAAAGLAVVSAGLDWMDRQTPPQDHELSDGPPQPPKRSINSLYTRKDHP